MLFSSWLRHGNRMGRSGSQTPPRQRTGFRPQLTVLEDRCVLSTLIVTNLNDSGAGSLRAQIAAAQSGDTVAFDPALAGQAVNLTNGELAINKNLTIQGTSGSYEVLDANYLGRALHVTDAAVVTLENLMITGGWGVRGAGIYNDGGTLTINDSNVSGNSTDSPSYNGGGIYNNGGTVTLNRSVMSNNDAEFHYVAGGGNGGGIYNAGGTVTINDSSLFNNYAYQGGGGIYNAGGTVMVIHSDLTGNGAFSDGGIYNAVGGVVTVINSSNLSGNSPEDVYNGGVVYLDISSTISVLHGNPAILFDPNAPQLQIYNVTTAEGNTGTLAALFTVTLSTASTQTVTVAYATADGTATLGNDYLATSGTLTFAPGETNKTFMVLVKGDRLGESDETFSANLSAATNAIITTGHATGIIIDDEPHISISDVTKFEGKKGQTTLFTFTVSLSAAYDQAVTMSFRTVNGTASSGSDYVARTGTLTFAPGETTKTISISVNGDSKREADEVFHLDLFGNSSNSWFTKNRGIGTILNDD